MYTSYNREVINNLESSTKYTEYLKTLSNGDIRGGRGGNIFDDGGGGFSRTKSQRRSRRNNFQGSTPLLPISDNEVKFANIFSPNESNALKLHLLQKTSSLPLLDHTDSSNARASAALLGDDDDDSVDGDHDDPRLLNRRRSTALGLLHENPSNSNAIPRRKGDPVANILYSTIRHGAATNNNNSTNDYDNPSADETLHTGSDSKVDYDPHEPLAAVDQIALRHELLNNIRAISRATYFEDLYTGKVRRNSGSPEAEILRLLENPNGAVGNRSIAEETLGERTIPSKDTSLSRVDRWIKESSEVNSEAANNDTDDDKEGKHASLYHQSVWNEEQAKGKQRPKGRKVVGERNEAGVGGISDATTESDVETASAYIRRTSKTTKYKQSKPVTDHDSGPDNNKHFSRNTDRSVVSRSMGKPLIPPGIIESSASYLQAKYLNDSRPILHSNKNDQFLGVDSSSQHGARRPFSFGFNSSNDDLVPISVSLPNVAQNNSNSYRSTPLPMHATSLKKHSVSRPENLNLSMANLSTGTTTTKTTTTYKTRLDKRKMNGASNEQVVGGRRTMVHQTQQKSLPQAPKGKTKVNRVPDRAVPGLYSRLNMNQWVVKKVCFYLNGDELHPRFEYRFRPGKDIRDLDQLLDMLTKRFPTLPTGARHIFTMDGYLISSLEELIHENSYLVSSTRKFKAIKHEHGSNEGENNQRGNKSGGHQVLTKQLSTSDGNLQRSKRSTEFSQSQSFASQLNSLNSKSVSDVPRLVAHVIEEASSTAALLNHSPLMAREPIRVINGSRPSLQSQVLLNTKTSQPFEDLVKDLAHSVNISKQPIGNCLKTLAGRQIRSYSQLRSELKAGQRAFFIYSENKPVVASTLKPTDHPNSERKGKPIVKAALGKVNSNSSSDLSFVANEGRIKDTRRKPHHQRRRSHSPTANMQMNSRLTNARSPSPYNSNFK